MIFEYCPICGRDIEASNTEQVESGESDTYLFIHDDIVHEEDDIIALEYGIQ